MIFAFRANMFCLLVVSFNLWKSLSQVNHWVFLFSKPMAYHGHANDINHLWCDQQSIIFSLIYVFIWQFFTETGLINIHHHHRKGKQLVALLRIYMQGCKISLLAKTEACLKGVKALKAVWHNIKTRQRTQNQTFKRPEPFRRKKWISPALRHREEWENCGIITLS